MLISFIENTILVPGRLNRADIGWDLVVEIESRKSGNDIQIFLHLTHESVT